MFQRVRRQHEIVRTIGDKAEVGRFANILGTWRVSIVVAEGRALLNRAFPDRDGSEVAVVDTRGNGINRKQPVSSEYSTRAWSTNLDPYLVLEERLALAEVRDLRAKEAPIQRAPPTRAKARSTLPPLTFDGWSDRPKPILSATLSHGSSRGS